MKPDSIQTHIVQVEQQEQSQQQLLQRIRQADSQTKWHTGECISALKQRYHLTDEQIAQQTELSRETITQRRLVWETFADCKSIYNHLSWTHYYVALSWDDAPECLQWADELQASVSEMKAWRRSQHGADLSEPDEHDSWSVDPPAGSTNDVQEITPGGANHRDEKQADVAPARAERETLPVEVSGGKLVESRNTSGTPLPRSPEQRLDAAIAECVNVHAAILATRKLSRAVLESADREQLREFADELQSQLNIIRGHLRGLH